MDPDHSKDAALPKSAPKGMVTNIDPRLEQLEPMLSQGDWRRVLSSLGPLEQAGHLPPNLGLIYAIALSETGSEEQLSEANRLGIRCAAGLYGVAPDSAIALMIGKRLLRRNPVTWRKKPAPSTGVSIFIVFLTLLIGSAVGWVLSSGWSLTPILNLFRH